MTIDLNIGSAHSLGVASTSDGAHWSQSGSATLETKTESGANVSDVYDVYIYNKVNYRRYYNSCYPKAQYWKPISFADLVSNDLMYYAGHKAYNGQCQQKTQGNYYKAKGSNTTYSGGVTLTFISLISHASFSSDTREAWNVQTGQATRLCGSGTQGWPTDALADGRPW